MLTSEELIKEISTSLVKAKVVKLTAILQKEQLFDWMIDPRVLIAVKVFAVEALFNMHNRFPWISDELANHIQF